MFNIETIIKDIVLYFSLYSITRILVSVSHVVYNNIARIYTATCMYKTESLYFNTNTYYTNTLLCLFTVLIHCLVCCSYFTQSIKGF